MLHLSFIPTSLVVLSENLNHTVTKNNQYDYVDAAAEMFPLSPDGSPSKKKKLSQAEIDAVEKARHEKEQKRLRAMLSNFCKNGVPQGGFLRSINLEQFGIESGSNITNATVQELCALLPGGIDELIISNCVDVTDVACWAIARHCPDIKSLIMAHCNQITNIGLRSLSLKCNDLKKLDFTGCHLLDDMALATLAGNYLRVHA